MTLRINGTAIGEIIGFEETTPTYVAAHETPGDTPIPAYKTGRGHDVIKMMVKATSVSSFFLNKRLIKNLINTEDVLYVDDTTLHLYNGDYGFWGIITAFSASLNARSLGEFTIEIIVTTDHLDSGYIPA